MVLRGSSALGVKRVRIFEILTASFHKRQKQKTLPVYTWNQVSLPGRGLSQKLLLSYFVSLHYDVSFYFVVLRYRPHCKRIIGFAKEQNHSQNYSRPISVRMHVMDSRSAMIGPAAWSKSQPRSASRLSSPPRDAEFYLAVCSSNLTNSFLHFRFISVLVYYLRYRALRAEICPCRRAHGSAQLLEVRHRNRTHRRSPQGQRQRLHTRTQLGQIRLGIGACGCRPALSGPVPTV